MGDIWQEHRRFILLVVGGLLGFLLLWLIVGEVFGSDVGRYKRMISASKRNKQSLPSGVSLNSVKKERKQLEKAFTALSSSMARQTEAGYRLPADERSPENYYGAKVDELRRGFVETCAVRNIALDGSLGLPRETPVSRRRIDWFLRGLDVVRQVLATVISVDSEIPGGIARVQKISIKRPTKSRNQKRRVEKPFLRKRELSFEIVGEPAAVDLIIRNFARPSSTGRYLAVKRERIRSLDEAPSGVRKRRRSDPRDHSRVLLEVTVIALDIDRAGQVAKVGRRR